MNSYAVMPFVLATISALGFSWPLVSKAAQLTPIMTAIMYVIGTAVAVGAGSQFFEFGAVPSTKAVFLGIVAGLLNGVAMISYSMLISNNEKWDMSVYLPLVIGLMLIFITLGGIFFFKEAATYSKMAGIVAILIGVYLLR
ncbi:MAG: hypothetical protein HY432_00795 [Candidatus Liptonbacteria bacterium]|nr:hypothetical protein [Candidatus Liptonbacteria bacterium]